MQQDNNHRAWLFAGVFICTASLLFLEVFSVRIISVAVGDSTVYYVISIAMLGIGAAGALISVMKPVADAAAGARRASWFMLVAALAVFALFIGITAYNDMGNRMLDSALAESAAVREGEIPADYMRAYMYAAMLGVPIVGALMFLPYLLFGLVLSVLFRSADHATIPRLYSVDLVGACCGAVLAIVALDNWQFTSTAVFATLLPLLAALCFAMAAGSRRLVLGMAGGAVAGIAVLAVPGVREQMEAQPHLGSLGRTQHLYVGNTVNELWRTWTSFGRLGAIELTDTKDGNRRIIMAQGSGEGHARVLPANQPIDESKIRPAALPAAVRFTLEGCKAERVLVLMAGAGADMVLLDKYAGGKADITGVEIEPEVYRWLMRELDLGLKEFFDRPNIRMRGAEGREYLARDDTRYDCILRSFSGASRAFFAGANAAAQTPLLTTEGLSDILDHLAPGGHVTLLRQRSTDLLTIAELFRARGKQNIERDFFLVATHERTRPIDPLFAQNSNVFFLLVKPDGFTVAETARLWALAQETGMYVYYSPDHPSPLQQEMRSYFLAPDGYQVANDMLRAHGKAVYRVNDNRPFADDEFPMYAYRTLDFWLNRANPDFSSRTNNVWNQRHRHVMIVLGLTVGSILLILAPLWYSYVRHRRARVPGTVNHLVYFAGLGAAFMFIEMGLIQKLQLLVGHPGHTIAVVLASLILFTGIGSSLSGRLFASGVLNFRRAGLLVTGASLLTVAVVEFIMPELVGLGRLEKMVLAFAIPAFPAFFMGQLFPQGLAAMTKNEELIPLSMGVNAMTGTIASGLGVVLAQVAGYRFVLLLGCAIYLAVALMPHRRRSISLAEAGAGTAVMRTGAETNVA